MSLTLNSEAVCVFCYKAINCPVQSTGTPESTKKFIKLLDRFAGRTTSANFIVGQATHENLSALLFKLCKECTKITDQFCELYNQFKLLELQLDLKLNKLVEVLDHANKVPTRWIHLTKVLDEKFPEDLINKIQAQNVIRDLRQSVVDAAKKRQSISQPRVLVKMGNLLDKLDEGRMKTNQLSEAAVFCDELPPKTISPKGTNARTSSETHEKSQLFTLNGNLHNQNFDAGSKQEDTGQENTFPCKLCNKQFPQLSQLQQHINMKLCLKIYKDANGNFVCPECGKRFSAISFLTYHLEFHKDPKEWKWECGECGRKCVSKVSLNTHMRTHTQEKPFVCRFCGKKYGYNISLKSHLVKWHGHENGVSLKKKKDCIKPIRKARKEGRIFESDIDKEKKLSWCKICKKSFPNFKDFRKHLDNNLCKKKGNRFGENVKCEDCEVTFGSDNALWLHQKEIHGDKVCLECGKQFTANYNYNLHLEYHKDPKEWKFECKICGRKCASKYKLKEHLVICTKRSNKKSKKKETK